MGRQMASAYAATHIESMCNLSIASKTYVHRMSGIICTIGRHHTTLFSHSTKENGLCVLRFSIAVNEDVFTT